MAISIDFLIDSSSDTDMVHVVDVFLLNFLDLGLNLNIIILLFLGPFEVWFQWLQNRDDLSQIDLYRSQRICQFLDLSLVIEVENLENLTSKIGLFLSQILINLEVNVKIFPTHLAWELDFCRKSEYLIFVIFQFIQDLFLIDFRNLLWNNSTYKFCNLKGVW